MTDIMMIHLMIHLMIHIMIHIMINIMIHLMTYIMTNLMINVMTAWKKVHSHSGQLSKNIGSFETKIHIHPMLETPIIPNNISQN